MWHSTCLAQCVLMALCFGGVFPQFAPPTTDTRLTFNLYLQGMSFDTKTDLKNTTSAIYREMRETIRQTFSPLGGTLEDVVFSDGGGCVKAYIVWRDGNKEKVMDLTDRLKTSGFMIWGVTWRVSFNDCGAATGGDNMLQFTFFVVGMPWMDAFKNKQSSEYLMAKQMVATQFAKLGGQMRALELEQTHECVKFYVEWDATDPTNILSIMQSLTSNGFTAMGMTFKVQTKPCLPTTDDALGCPPVELGMLGICVEACNDNDPALKCPENFKCCSNGCGHVCKRVGYKLKINSTLALSLPYNPNLSNTPVGMSREFGQAIKAKMQEKFNMYQKDAFNDVEIVEKMPWRHEESTMTAVRVVIFLSSDPSNDVLEMVRAAVEGSSLVVSSQTIAILVMTYGNPPRDMYPPMCGRSKCMGLCKEMRSGMQYCSCNSGYTGPECSVFDCRKNYTQYMDITEHHCINGGRCALANDDRSNGFRCQCPSGNYGDRCQVKMCDYLKTPCANNGKCVGRFMEGKICECMSGTGGFLCESNVAENLSECEAKRRMMTMVRNQLLGVRTAQHTSVPMVKLLDMMGVKEFGIPYCWQQGDPSAGGYHSVCMYDSMTGEKKECKCLSKDGQPNSWYYFGEGDCRVFSGELLTMENVFYILDSTWTDDLRNSESALYQEIKKQIYDAFSPLGGGMHDLTFKERDGCISMRVVWLAENTESRKAVLQSFMGNGLSVNGEKKKVSDLPCVPMIDLNACPPMKMNSIGFGTCAAQCDITKEDSCGDGKKCCPNSCRGTNCVEVGFLQKMRANITIDLAFSAEYADNKSMVYQLISQSIQGGVDTLVKTNNLKGYKSTKVLGFYPTKVENFQRSKRQAMPQKTIIGLEMKFTEDLPVEDLIKIRDNLMKNGFTYGGTTWNVLEFKLGEDGPCPNVPCASDSICVTRIGGERQCACPEARTGQMCNLRNCMVEGISLCMNGGTCEFSGMDNDLRCMCPAGYIGELCENRVCDYVKEGTCNSGKCIGDIMSFSMCSCPPGSGGLFCEQTKPDGEMTTCQLHRRVAEYSMSVLNGTLPDDKLTVSMREFLVMMGDDFIVPKCWPMDAPNNRGDYRSICGYDMYTKETTHCWCTSPNGEPNYWDYDQVTGECQVTIRQSCDGVTCHNGGTCMNQPGGSYHCLCSKNFTGPHCERDLTIKLCEYIRPGTCNKGQCVGDFNNFTLCSCPDGKGGLFCEKNEPDSKMMTLCQRQYRLAHYALSVLNGSVPDNKTTVSMSEFLRMIGDMFAVPKCHAPDSSRSGNFHSFCIHNFETGDRGECWCTDARGDPNYWYYDYKSGQCQVYQSKGCDFATCYNGGTCHNQPDGGFYCECMEGYMGQYCEIDPEHKCPFGFPLMTDTGPQTCRTGPCPTGFTCEVEPADRWTACCFNRHFLCELNPCQAGGSCIGDLYMSTMCACPTGRRGLFCERIDNSYDNRTICQKKQEFHNWVVSVLETGTSTLGVDRKDLRLILGHMGYEYYPTDLCDASGNFKTIAQGVFLRNPQATRKEICMDKEGKWDPKCRTAVCEKMKLENGKNMCQHDIICKGDVTDGLCDCSGTGYHGVLCELPGESKDETQCTRVRDIGHFARGILNGSLSPHPNMDLVKRRINEILDIHKTDKIWVPNCDKKGQFEYRGCVYDREDPQKKSCFCAMQNGEMFGEVMSSYGPPENCMGDEQGGQKCLKEWGEDCKQPDWWCSETKQCEKGKERCSYTVGCSGSECDDDEKDDLMIECVPKATRLPCDPRPCKHNPYMMCHPCGKHGKCYNLRKGVGDDSNAMDMDEAMMDMGRDMMGSEWMDDEGWFDSEDMMMDYTCDCNVGYEGYHCEVNKEICRTLPGDFCEMDCVGDIDMGMLCSCEPGYGGMLCDKPARTHCEMRKALYDDALAILRGEMTIESYNQVELQELVKLLTKLNGESAIPELNCTDAGFYNKVQCEVSVDSLKKGDCYCVDHKGEQISSNVRPYIGYELCTAPTDFRMMSKSICNLTSVYASYGVELNVCQNGGQCVFDPFAGKTCECPSGFTGMFCERKGDDSDKSVSMCDWLADAWDITHAIKTNNTPWIKSDMQRELYFNLTYNFLHPARELGYAVKAECNPDGTFKPAVCYYNIVTGQRGYCHCWGSMGPIVTSVVDGPDTTACPTILKEMEGVYCKEREDQCPHLKCPFGFKRNQMMCETCACRHPCENMKCRDGERCVEMKKVCDDMGRCSEPMCMRTIKPGVCPGHSATSFSTIIGGGFGLSESSAGSQNDTCQVKCLDDADCEGKKKCCGLCGNQCVDPIETFDCQQEVAKMRNHLEFLNKVAQSRSSVNELSRDVARMVDRLAEEEFIWMPKCDSDGYRFQPLQCMYSVATASSGNPEPHSCFCVDSLGHRIEGAKAEPGDPNACMQKPFSCPVLEPSDLSARDQCKSDMDCVGGDKCCDDKVRKVCARPVDAEKLKPLVGRMMDKLCVDNKDMCQGGSTCRGKWMEEGVACDCPQGRFGPFCELRVVDIGVVPRTVCERKRLAVRLFREQMTQAHHNMSAAPMGMGKLIRMEMERKMEMMGSDFDMRKESVSMVAPACKDDGEFAPTQCIVELGMDNLQETVTHCFCVDEKGQELLGTRKPFKEGMPFCGDKMHCPVGHAFHQSDTGILMECGRAQQCPMGYTCKRSTYGHLYCCPTTDGLQDVCKIPMDVGMACMSDKKAPADSAMMGPEKRYFFEPKSGECKEFEYKGCGGNGNNFKNLNACMSRCKEKINPGTCPDKPFQVSAGNALKEKCKDSCGKDSDCDASYKCCQSSCGKRCIPAIDETVSSLLCPMGIPRNATKEQMICDPQTPCPKGYFCRKVPNSRGPSGVCCPDYNEENLCMIPPKASERCFDSVERYFFNSSSKQCEKFRYSGCDPEFNNFKTLEECCEACNGEGRCKRGTCPAIKLGVGTCKHECSADIQCPDKKICCSNGCGHTCVVPEVEQGSDCLVRQREVKLAMSHSMKDEQGKKCDVTNIPMCEKNGTWSRTQCQVSLGICWCVTPHGHYVPNTITKGVPRCDSLTEAVIARADLMKMDVASVNYQVCPAGQDFHCCPKSLCDKKCYAHPEAICRINPCGGCRAEFYNAAGEKVECEKGLSDCEKELSKVSTIIQARHLTAKMAMDKDMDDMDIDDDYNMDEDEMQRPRALRTDIPLKCQHPPETGQCKGYLPQWYYDPNLNQCNMFIWGMCGGNENRFKTAEQCYASCNSSGNPCNLVDCPVDAPVCKLEYDTDCHQSKMCEVRPVCVAPRMSNHVMGIFVPKCFMSGEYSLKQCHGDYCWCVNSDGSYFNGLTNSNTHALECTANGKTPNSPTGVAPCPNGRQPNPNCLKVCRDKVCPGNPMAKCVVDLCSDTCSTKFVDEDGSEVTCEDDVCKVFSFDEARQERCAAPVPCKGQSIRTCPESVCEKAKAQNCSRNPCAICMVDPCTCQPYFEDIVTRNRINQAQCNFFSLGMCELKTCDVLMEVERARFNKIDLSSDEKTLPECDTKGKFKPKQCRGTKCECVDEFGVTMDGDANGNCKAIDTIKQVKLTLKYNVDYKKLKADNKIEEVKKDIIEKLVAKGIDRRTIKKVEVYEGSTIVDVVFGEDKDAVTKDMAVINQLLQSVKKDIRFTVDGQDVAPDSDGTSVQALTASQVDDEDDDDSGLDKTEKIIIGVVCGAVGLLIIGVICYGCCCHKRKEPEVVDDQYDHIRETKVATLERQATYDNPAPFYNKAYEEDGHYMKVRL